MEEIRSRFRDDHARLGALLEQLGSAATPGDELGLLALWAVFEPYLINRVFSQENFELVTNKYNEYGVFAVFIAAFTPIPYKVFTVAAGVAKLNLVGFTLASIVGRGGRFFLVALVIRMAGPRARKWIDEYFNLATVVGTLLLIGGFLLIKFLK